MMHSRVLLAFGLGVLLAMTGVAQAQKLAVVNMQRAIEESAEGKAALSKLKGELERKQKELDGKKDELKKMDDDLNKQASVLKPDALEKKKHDMQQKLMQLQEAAMRSQRELQEKEQKATQPIVDKIIRAINVIAARDKFIMVLQQSAVVWPQHSEYDITNEVIRKTNEMK